VSTKISVGRVHTDSYVADTAQAQARTASVKVNAHVDAIAVLNNRSYTALATDTGNVAAAAYAKLIDARITTLLSRGYLIITLSASGTQITNAATVFFQILVDGAVVKGLYTTVPVTFSFNAAMLVRVPVVKGTHVVTVQWKTNANSVRISAKTVNEEHAHLLVQEAA
jgi:hypothetical protein